MRSHRRLDTVIRVSDGVVWVGRRERDRPAPGDEVVIPADVSPLERG
jgi:hypothetical protein